MPCDSVIGTYVLCSTAGILSESPRAARLTGICFPGISDLRIVGRNDPLTESVCVYLRELRSV